MKKLLNKKLDIVFLLYCDKIFFVNDMGIYFIKKIFDIWVEFDNNCNFILLVFDDFDDYFD